MSATITGKLNKPATQFQAGESTGFGLRLGVQYYDRETKNKEWTNYEAVIFAKAPGQVNFYQEALVEGAIVEITAKSQKIKQFQGKDKLILSIELVDASIGHVSGSAQPAQQQSGFQQQAPPQQGGFQQQQGFQQQPQQQAPQQQQGYQPNAAQVAYDNQQQGGYQNQPGK